MILAFDPDISFHRERVLFGEFVLFINSLESLHFCSENLVGRRGILDLDLHLQYRVIAFSSEYSCKYL